MAVAVVVGDGGGGGGCILVNELFWGKCDSRSQENPLLLVRCLMFDFPPPSPLLRGHGDSQTVVLFPPKTPPRHFHHQKVLCNKSNIYICIALKIINTPVN